MQDPTDSAAGIETTDEFKQFAQKNDVFTRAFGIRLSEQIKQMPFSAATEWRPSPAEETVSLKKILRCVMPAG